MSNVFNSVKVSVLPTVWERLLPRLIPCNFLFVKMSIFPFDVLDIKLFEYWFVQFLTYL